MSSTKHLTQREKALSDLLIKYKDLPAQGSEQWLHQRKHSVGGSQIATILGINRFETMQSLVKSKAGIGKFKKSAPLWFGNLMEHCVEQYVKLRWNATVVETGSITHTIDCISYSPDGLCIIKKNKLKHMTEKDMDIIQSTSMFDKSDELLVLMEFKSPFSRIPIAGTVPKYYIPQPQLGMCVIPITEVSLFIECVFRFCCMDDMYSTNYSSFHYDKKRFSKKALAYSAISVVCDTDNVSNDVKKMIRDLKSQMSDFEQMDLGTIQNKKLLTSLLEQLVDGELTPVYHSLLGNTKKLFDDDDEWTFHKYNNQIRLDNEINSTRANHGSNYIGFLPYKLFDANVNTVFKKNILTQDVIDKTRSVIELAKKIMSETDETSIRKLITDADSL